MRGAVSSIVPPAVYSQEKPIGEPPPFGDVEMPVIGGNNLGLAILIKQEIAAVRHKKNRKMKEIRLVAQKQKQAGRVTAQKGALRQARIVQSLQD